MVSLKGSLLTCKVETADQRTKVDGVDRLTLELGAESVLDDLASA